MKYRSIIDKVDSGKELTDDVNAIQAYKNRHPGKELPENVKNEIQDFVDRTEAELLTMAQEVAKEQGISVEKAIDFILQQTESADKTSKFANLLDRANLARAELNFINGRQITSNSNGSVKIGSRFLYNKNTEHVYTRGNEEYRQETGKDFDSTDTNIGKGVKTTGQQAVLGDAVDSAKRSFKQSIKFWDSKFWDDKTSSVGGKIRNFVVDQGVDLLSGATAAGAGAAIGTFIGGPIGTVAGFALGAAIGYAMDNFKINELNNQSITDVAKDALTKTTDAIGDGLKTIGGWFS